MRMYDVDGNLVNVDVRSSKYPIRSVSRSNLQGVVAQSLKNKYPNTSILEDFTIPGSRMSVDFFLPLLGMVLEVQGKQHDAHCGFFHGDRNTSKGYAKQVVRDRQKYSWAEVNGFRWIEIREEEDLEQLNGI